MQWTKCKNGGAKKAAVDKTHTHQRLKSAGIRTDTSTRRNMFQL